MEIPKICVVYLFILTIQLVKTNHLQSSLFSTEPQEEKQDVHSRAQDVSESTLSRTKRQIIYDYDPYYRRYRQPFPIPIPIIIGGGFIAGRGFGYGGRGFGGRGFGGRGFGGRGFGGRGFGGRGFGGRGIGGRGIGGGLGGRG